MKKILAILLITALLGAVAFVAWDKEWLVSTPASVFKDSLAKANAGRYEEATQNVFGRDSGGMLNDHKLMKEVWNKVTKDGTIRSVEAKSDGREMEVLRGCTFVITYQDGSKMSGHVPGAYHGGWRHGIRDLYEKIVAEEFESSTIPLAEGYARFEDTEVSLRLPQGSVWNARERRFEIQEFDVFLFDVKSPRMTPFAMQEKWVERQWAVPENTLSERHDNSKGGVKSVLFEGDSKNAKGNSWHRFHLVIGDEKDAIIIGAVAPKQENVIAALRECLKSARWGPEIKK